jgi:penicillin-binding protein 1A
MGNDDFSPTKRMTGGTLPAMTWHNIMAYAHQGIELRALPGLPPPQHAPTIADASFKADENPHPVLLTRKGTDALIQLEHMFDEANHALTAQGAPAGSLGALDDKDRGGAGSNAYATAADRNAASSTRGD